MKRLSRLEVLDISGSSQITDGGLVHLEDLPKLESLFVFQTQVTDEGVKKLQQALPNCKVHHKPLPRRR